MSDKLTRRGLITSGTAGALGVLALTGCTPARKPRRGLSDGGARRQAGGQDCWTFDAVWRPDHDEVPKMGYNRAARSIFKLARLWRAEQGSENGGNRPPAALLREWVERPDFHIKDIETHPTGTLQEAELWPPRGTEGDTHFLLLWRLLREVAQGMFLLAGHGPQRQWLLCPTDPGGGAAAYLSAVPGHAAQPVEEPEEGEFVPREDGLSPPERRALSVAIGELEAVAPAA